MPSGRIQGIEIVFPLLLLFVVAFGTLARRIAVPYPIVLVIGGLVLSFIPGLPNITLDPEFVFLVILPPLLGHVWIGRKILGQLGICILHH